MKLKFAKIMKLQEKNVIISLNLESSQCGRNSLRESNIFFREQQLQILVGFTDFILLRETKYCCYTIKVNLHNTSNYLNYINESSKFCGQVSVINIKNAYTLFCHTLVLLATCSHCFSKTVSQLGPIFQKVSKHPSFLPICQYTRVLRLLYIIVI